MAKVWPVKKGYVETAFGQIHYRRCADESPTILLLHAAQSSSSMFTSAIPRFATRGLSAVAIDLPNCGESYNTRGEPKLPDLAQAILAAAEGLGFPPSFNVVGHQVGASLAIYLAAQYPQHIKKVILWGVPILGVMGRGDLLREEAPDYGGDFLGVVNSFVTERYPDENFPWQLKVRGLIDMLQTADKRMWSARPMALVDNEGMLKDIKQPTLCMAGDSEPNQKTTMKAALLVQNGKYHNLGPAGIDVVDEFADEYVQAVTDFVRASGIPVERSSCTIPAVKPEPVNRRTSEQPKTMSIGGDKDRDFFDSEDIKSRPRSPHESIPSPTTTLNAGVVSADSSVVNSPLTSLQSSPDRRNSSERRSSTDRRRLTFKNLVKGKFS